MTLGDVDYQGRKVNLEREKRAILKFLKRYWDVEVDFEALPFIVERQLHDGFLFGVAHQENDYQENYVSLNSIKNGFNCVRETLHMKPHIITLQFTRVTDPSYITFGSIDRFWGVEAQPKRYDKFKKRYNESREGQGMRDDWSRYEFDGFTAFDRAIHEEFKFPQRMSRKSVAYNEFAQDRTPSQTMQDCILLQGKYIGVMAVQQKYRDDFRKEWSKR